MTDLESEQQDWFEIAQFLRDNPGAITWIEENDPDLFRQIEGGLQTQAIEAKADEWRSPIRGFGGRPAQLIPGTPGAFSERTDWFCWLLMGGRGSGKSRTGAEAVREFLLNREWVSERPNVALVGQTLSDVRINMVENTLIPILEPLGVIDQWNRGTCELWLKKGQGYLKGYSSEAPRLLRGPNFHLAWADELATWTDADRSPGAVDTTLSNLKMALRAQDGGRWKPRLIATTTPKSVKILRNQDEADSLNPGPGLVDDPRTVVSNMSTLENESNLADFFIEGVVEPLRGTRLFAQEVLGHLMDESLGALWSSEQIDAMRCMETHPTMQAGGFKMKVLAIDPSIGKGLGDECGIVVAGRCVDGRVYILEDASLRGDPAAWAKRALEMARKWEVQCAVAEVNQGGEMVMQTLTRYAPKLPVVSTWAKRGKKLRAEPVAIMSDRDKIRLAGRFPELERQMRTWDPENDKDSPDRVDAMVYAALYLAPPRDVGGLVRFDRMSALSR